MIVMSRTAALRVPQDGLCSAAMDDEQFRELMDCLNNIASRLDAIESVMSDINYKQGEYCAYTLEDVTKALWDVEKAAGR